MDNSQNYYDGIASGYNELYGEEQMKKWNVAKNLISFDKNDVVLDFGCGTGVITQLVASKVKHIIGVDSSKKMLELVPKTDKIETVLCNEHVLPFKNKYFDKAVSFTVLQDILEWDWILRELRRVVRGELLVTVLKRGRELAEVREKISVFFRIERFVEEEKDFIFLLHSNLEEKKLNRGEATAMVNDFIHEVLSKERWFINIKSFTKAIVIYGSTAKGTNRPDSDIDLLIIVPADVESKYTCGEYYYDFKGREINIVLRSIERMRRIALESRDKFQAEVFRGAEIIWQNDDEVRRLIDTISGIK